MRYPKPKNPHIPVQEFRVWAGLNVWKVRREYGFGVIAVVGFMTWGFEFKGIGLQLIA